MDAVSSLFRNLANAVREMRCRVEGVEALPSGVTYKDFFRRFPDATGADVYRKYLGKVDTVPVPKNLIEMAPRLGFKLVFIPEYITITVDKDSPLTLDKTTAVNGKQARLVEDPERASKEQAREIKVPVTPNNMILLVQKYLKKYSPASQFEGIDKNSWQSVLNQNGDIGVGESHWSYQKEAVLGLRTPYRSQPGGEKGQIEIAQSEGLEIVPLVHRILFHLLSYIKSGNPPQSDYFERTSTSVLDGSGRSWQSVIWWPTCPSGFLLYLHFRYDECYRVGAVARAPAGSAQRSLASRHDIMARFELVARLETDTRG